MSSLTTKSETNQIENQGVLERKAKVKTKQIITWVTGLEISLDLMQGMFISEDNFIIKYQAKWFSGER